MPTPAVPTHTAVSIRIADNVADIRLDDQPVAHMVKSADIQMRVDQIPLLKLELLAHDIAFSADRADVLVRGEPVPEALIAAILRRGRTVPEENQKPHETPLGYHEYLNVGPLWLYRHDGDGNVVVLVDQTRQCQKYKGFIRAEDLETFLRRAFEEKGFA